MKARRLSPLLGALLCLTIFVAACGGETASTSQNQSKADLSGVKSYLQNKIILLQSSTSSLKQASGTFYGLAQQAQFDYLKLKTMPDALTSLNQAREAWKLASPAYEQMEGIVAGVSSLSEFDLILDAGDAGSVGGENVAPVDLKLPNGKVLEKPGNIFAVTESTLWGTDPAFMVKDQWFDFNANGTQDFGDAMPDANILKAGSDALDDYSNQLAEAAKNWTPTDSEAFTALTADIPTVGEFFESWKNSRFVSGDLSQKSRDFGVISRLSDIVDNVTSWQTIYSGLSPLAKSSDASQDTLINQDLTELKTFVSDLYKQEQEGKQFSPEDADALGNQAQQKADALNGRVTQLAATLNIKIVNS